MLYHHAKFGEIELRAAAVGAKMWCLYVCFYFFLSRSEAGGAFARVGYTLNSCCVAVYMSLSIAFTIFQK